MSSFDYWNRSWWDELDSICDRCDCVPHRLLCDSVANHHRCMGRKCSDPFDLALERNWQRLEAHLSVGTKILSNFRPILKLWGEERQSINKAWTNDFGELFVLVSETQLTCVMMPLILFCEIFGKHILWMSSRLCSFNVNVEPVWTPSPNFSAINFSVSGLFRNQKKN